MSFLRNCWQGAAYACVHARTTSNEADVRFWQRTTHRPPGYCFDAAYNVAMKADAGAIEARRLLDPRIEAEARAVAA